MRWITGSSRFSSAQCSSVAVPSMGACSVASRYILVMPRCTRYANLLNLLTTLTIHYYHLCTCTCTVALLLTTRVHVGGARRERRLKLPGG